MPKSPPVSPRYAKGRNVSQTATYLFNRVREGVFTRRTIRDDVKEKGFFFRIHQVSPRGGVFGRGGDDFKDLANEGFEDHALQWTGTCGPCCPPSP